MKDYLKIGVGILLVAVMVIFTVQNVASVTLKFLAWELSMSQSLLIFFVLLSGVVLGWLVAGWLYWNRSRKQHKT